MFLMVPFVSLWLAKTSLFFLYVYCCLLCQVNDLIETLIPNKLKPDIRMLKGSER